MPAGRPILSISLIVAPSIFSFLRCSLIDDSLLIRQTVTSMDEISCDTTVGTATPATPILSTMTHSRLSSTFTTPAMKRKYSGRFVSPTARSTDAPKLYSAITGKPAK